MLTVVSSDKSLIRNSNNIVECVTFDIDDALSILCTMDNATAFEKVTIYQRKKDDTDDLDNLFYQIYN